MIAQNQISPLDQITDLLAEHGFDGLAEAVAVLINEVMNQRVTDEACLRARAL